MNLRFCLSVLAPLLAVLMSCSVDTTGLLPVDDVDAAPDAPNRDAGPDPVDAGDDVPISFDGGQCTDGERICRDNLFRECMGGAFEILESCSLGCFVGEPRCRRMRVSTVDDALLYQGTAELRAEGGSTLQLNSETGAIRNGETVIRAEGEGDIDGVVFTLSEQDGSDLGVGVFSFESLYIDSTSFATGTGSRPLVLLVSGEVVVDGEFDVGGRDRTPGPGGFGGAGSGDASGPGAGQHDCDAGLGYWDAAGGGGGGHASVGGNGGREGDASTQGGAAIEDRYATPLIGGGGAGAGCGDGTGSIVGGSSNGGDGGGGGGALQISSATSIEVAGVIRSPGARGQEANRAGGGGGAGGTILLESPTIKLTGVLSANGGTGGQGRGGSDGLRGGDAAAPTEGPGGAGAGGGGDMPDGGRGADDPDNFNGGNGASGGGGSAGRIVIKSPDFQNTGTVTPVLGSGSDLDEGSLAER